jgi:hypothetical protein
LAILSPLIEPERYDQREVDRRPQVMSRQPHAIERDFHDGLFGRLRREHAAVDVDTQPDRVAGGGGDGFRATGNRERHRASERDREEQNETFHDDALVIERRIQPRIARRVVSARSAGCQGIVMGLHGRARYP